MVIDNPQLDLETLRAQVTSKAVPRPKRPLVSRAGLARLVGQAMQAAVKRAEEMEQLFWDPMQALYFLSTTLFDIYLMVVAAAHLVAVGPGRFYNPEPVYCQGNPSRSWPHAPRHSEPRQSGSAAVVLALMVALLKFCRLCPAGRPLPALAVDVQSALLVLKQAGSLLFWMLVLRHPQLGQSGAVARSITILLQLTEPMLAPIRGSFPHGRARSVVLVLFLILQAVNIFSTTGWIAPSGTSSGGGSTPGRDDLWLDLPYPAQRPAGIRSRDYMATRLKVAITAPVDGQANSHLIKYPGQTVQGGQGTNPDRAWRTRAP